jgi:hypothetical protein
MTQAPDIFHVTPITPNAALESVCAGRNLMVSFYRPDQLASVRRIAGKRMADNGRFSEWMAALKRGKEWSEENLDNRPYYAWLEPWIDEPETVAIMPDIPGAPSQLNDGQLIDWPFKLEKGVPVYHMDGPIVRFGRLAEKYPLVAMGWIGDPKREPVGCEAYWRRVEEIESELGYEIWTRTHMLRGVAVARGRPFRPRGQQQPRAERPPLRQPYGRTLGRPVARTPGLRRQIGRKAV